MKGVLRCRKNNLVATIATLMLATFAGGFGVGFAEYLYAYAAATKGTSARSTRSRPKSTRTQARNESTTHHLRLAQALFPQRKGRRHYKRRPSKGDKPRTV